jgi:hypothetical protein
VVGVPQLLEDLMKLELATMIEDICGANGCDAGETILGLALILAVMVVLVAFLRMS